MARVVGILVAAALAAAAAARAEPEADRQAATCERAIATEARRGVAPAAVLRAISLTETGRRLGGALRPWPWAINREGEGFWFGSREEAIAFAKASLAQGRRSFDVGCFQINHHWHGDNFPSLEAMFDQETGAAYAARFLRELHTELGDWSAAAGAYHSRTPELALRYRARFDRLLAGIAGGAFVAADATVAEGPPATPRKSRTRMSGRPKIITLATGPSTDDALAAKMAAIRIERGRTPTGSAGGPAEDGGFEAASERLDLGRELTP